MAFYTFLPKILNMSLTASVAIVFVLLLRLLLKKAPKVISYALWGVVLFRLLCPVSIESGFSLFGLLETPTVDTSDRTSIVEYIPSNIVHTEYPEVVLPAPGIGEAITEALPEGEEQLRADPLEGPIFIGTYVWMGGILVMAIYGIVTWFQLRRRIVTASPLRENIYLADEIQSPFVMGLIRPKIYLPSDMEEREQSYIILHEQHHIRRLDHIVKAMAFVALCIHWFNPMVWVAFILSGKDMEMSCDEAVVRKLGTEIRADYTASLLSLATGKRIIAGMPLAFGEGNTKGRIKNLANWKKPAFWVVLVAVIPCVVLAVCLLTNPSNDDNHLTEDSYFLVIGAEGVAEIKVSSPGRSGGIVHADGSLYELGEKVYLEQLNGISDLRGVSITALASDGEVLYVLSIPEGATDAEIVNIVGSDGWLLAPTDFASMMTRNLVIKWFDYTDNPSAMEAELTMELPEYPGVTFTYNQAQIIASKPFDNSDLTGNVILIGGMPIWNAYFTDLTGDGYPDICATYTYGSGIIDSRIVICDYVNGASYELADRGYHDYYLRMNDADGYLYVDKRVYNSDELVSSGKLVFKDECIQIEGVTSEPMKIPSPEQGFEGNLNLGLNAEIIDIDSTNQILYVKDIDESADVFGERCAIDCNYAISRYNLLYVNYGDPNDVRTIDFINFEVGDSVIIGMYDSEKDKAFNGSAVAEQIQLATQRLSTETAFELNFGGNTSLQHNIVLTKESP